MRSAENTAADRREMGRSHRRSSPLLAARFIPVSSSQTTILWAAMATVFVTSLLWRQNGATPDVSWLSYMCLQILEGKTGWVDVIDTAPPSSALIYMPGAILSKIMPLGIEAAVFVSAYGAVFLALFVTRATLPHRLHGVGARDWALVFPAAIGVCLMPSDAFAQREWLAMTFALPFVAVFMHRHETGDWPAMRWRLIAAIFAGVSFAAKPPLFAAPFLALALFEMIRTRSLAFLFPSMLPVAGLIGVFLVGGGLVLFPGYMDIMAPIMSDIYVAIRADYSKIFGSTVFCSAVVSLCAFVLIRMEKTPPISSWLCVVVAGAYFGIFLAQGKYFSYHALPMAFYLVLALWLSLYKTILITLYKAKHARGSGKPYKANRNIAISTALGLLAFFVALIGFADNRAPTRGQDWATGLDNPTAMAISKDLGTSFPLAVSVGARWIDRTHAQWIPYYALTALQRGATDEEKTLLKKYYQEEIDRTRRLILEEQPDLIFQTKFKSREWLRGALLEGQPDLFDNYAPYIVTGGTVVLRRTD